MKTTALSSRRVRALIGAAIGAAAFLLIFGVRSLNVTDDLWILSGYADRDIVQHYAGWVFYRNSPIVFPLCFTTSINYPFGASILFSDSIPIASMFFRLLSPILPTTFQFFGIWVMLSFMLQGFFASKILDIFSKKLLTNIVGTVLFVFSPIMIERCFRHTSLSSHFLILAALYLYFRNKKEKYSYSPWYLVVSALAALIHPYFLPMVFAVLFADLFEHAVKTKEYIKSVGFLLANLAVSVVAFFCIGYFKNTSSGNHGGYGLFCFNFNSLFNPESMGGFTWSRILPAWDTVYINENFLFLGLGMFVALIAVGLYLLITFKRSKPLLYIKRYPVLFASACCLTLFAVSNVVTINDSRYILFNLSGILSDFANIFRSSSRMFWPVYYLIFIFLIIFIDKLDRQITLRKDNTEKNIKRVSVSLGAVLLLAVCAVQLFDMAPTLRYKHDDFKSGSNHFSVPTDNAFFEDNGDAFERVITIGGDSKEGHHIALFCAKNKIVTNEPFFSITNVEQYNEYADAEYEKLLSGSIDADTLYFFKDADKFAEAVTATEDSATAAIINEVYYVIIPNSGKVKLSADSADFEIVSAS